MEKCTWEHVGFVGEFYWEVVVGASGHLCWNKFIHFRRRILIHGVKSGIMKARNPKANHTSVEIKERTFGFHERYLHGRLNLVIIQNTTSFLKFSEIFSLSFSKVYWYFKLNTFLIALLSAKKTFCQSMIFIYEMYGCYNRLMPKKTVFIRGT